MEEDAPSQSKVKLIRIYMKLTGLQTYLNAGGPVMYACQIIPPSLGDFDASEDDKIIFSCLSSIERQKRLMNAYARNKHVHQCIYEDLVNHNYTEDELKQIVDFLELPVGNYFWNAHSRINAYASTFL